jgi:hypothetical protein
MILYGVGLECGLQDCLRNVLPSTHGLLEGFGGGGSR